MTINKSTLLLILCALANFGYTQTLSYYELRHFAISSYENKHMDEVLGIATVVYSLDAETADTTVIFEQTEYYDGEGNLAFAIVEDENLEEVRYWVKQLNQPAQAFTIYTNLGWDAAFTVDKKEDDATSIQFVQHDFRTNMELVSTATGVQVLADSMTSECVWNEEGYITEIVHQDKQQPTFKSNFEILRTDRKGNWTSRLIHNSSDGQTSTYLQKRTIKYEDQHEAARYFELKIDSLFIAGQHIRKLDMLRPRFRGVKPDSAEIQRQAQQERIFRFAENLYHRKYFNKDYFFDFNFSEKDELEVLENRFYGTSSTRVIDLRNNRYFEGRTSSERWFDKTSKYKTLERLEAEPTPTDEWADINGYRCRAYTRKNARGREEVFYVTEELPFVNYFEFTCRLPGFVMKSTRNISDWGEVTVVVGIEAADYPFRFLEFMDGLNDRFGTEIQYLHKAAAE